MEKAKKSITKFLFVSKILIASKKGILISVLAKAEGGDGGFDFRMNSEGKSNTLIMN